MPITAKEVNVADPFNPDDCLRGGTEYLASCLANVRLVVANDTNQDDLLRFALCSYNCGFGYVRAALRDILASGSPPTWASLKASLPHATVRGKKPDSKQAIGYVEKILP